MAIEKGISHETSSLVAHQQLGNLGVRYDDNHISIENDTAIAKSEDMSAAEGNNTTIAGEPSFMPVQHQTKNVPPATSAGASPALRDQGIRHGRDLQWHRAHG